jgi:hypothetical protein
LNVLDFFALFICLSFLFRRRVHFHRTVSTFHTLIRRQRTCGWSAGRRACSGQRLFCLSRLICPSLINLPPTLWDCSAFCTVRTRSYATLRLVTLTSGACRQGSQNGRCMKDGVSINDFCTAGDSNEYVALSWGGLSLCRQDPELRISVKGWPRSSQIMQPPVHGVTHSETLDHLGGGSYDGCK